MRKAITVFEEFPCFIMYNNLRFPFEVKHQTSGNLLVTDNSTVITVIPIEDEAARILNDLERVLEHRRHIKQRCTNDSMGLPSPSDLHKPEGDALVNKQFQHNILAALF